MYKIQGLDWLSDVRNTYDFIAPDTTGRLYLGHIALLFSGLLYTSDAADEKRGVDLGGRRIIKKKTNYITPKH